MCKEPVQHPKNVGSKLAPEMDSARQTIDPSFSQSHSESFIIMSDLVEPDRVQSKERVLDVCLRDTAELMQVSMYQNCQVSVSETLEARRFLSWGKVQLNEDSPTFTCLLSNPVDDAVGSDEISLD